MNLLKSIDLSMGIGFLILAALILSWLFWPSRVEKLAVKQNNRVEPTIATDEDDASEYDYMGSDEAIPAKLDLARAYMDMGEGNTAQVILEEVLKKGNNDQQAEAFGLLAKI